MTTVSRLEIQLDLDDKYFRANIRGSTAALARFRRAVGGTQGPMRQQERQLRSLGASFRHLVVTLGLLREALRTAWRASGGLIAGIVKVNAEFERLNVLLEGMSDGVTNIERAAHATEQFNQVIDLAKNAPFTVKELTNSWVKFKSVGVDPATGSLNSLVDAVARFGGTDDILHRATIAVQQMAGKGVISMEELRQQMGEAVPQALVLMARGLNMTVKEMVDVISKGQLTAKPALRKLFAEFRLTFGGASQRLMETFIGSMARLRTVWQLTLKEMGEQSGLFEAVKDEVKLLIEKLDDPAIRRFGIDIAIGMRKAFTAMVEFSKGAIQFFKDYGHQIKVAIAALAAWRVAMVLTAVEWKKMMAIMVATSKWFSMLPTLFGTIAIDLVAWIRRQKTLTAAIKATTVSLKGMRLASPIGWITLVIGAIAAWTMGQKDLKEEIIDTEQALKDYGEAASAATIEAEKGRLAIMDRQLAQLIEARNRALSQEGVTEDDESIKRMDDAIKAHERRIDELATRIDEAVNGAARRLAAKMGREATEALRLELEQALNEARDFDKKLSDQFDKGEISAEERLEARQENWNKFVGVINATTLKNIGPLSKEFDDLTASIRASSDPEEIERWKTLRAGVINSMRQVAVAGGKMAREIQEDINSISLDTELMTDKGGADDLLSDFQRRVEQAASKLAGLNAELADQGTEVAKFRAVLQERWVDENSWPEELRGVIKKILALLGEVDEKKEELAKKKLLESTLSQTRKQLARTREEAEMYREAVSGSMTELPNDQVRRFRRLLEGLGEKLREAGADMEEFFALRDELLQEAQNVNVLESVLDINGELQQLQIDQATTARERFDIEMEILEAQYARLLAMNAESDHLDLLIEKMNELKRAKEEAFENDQGFRKWARDNEDIMDNLTEAAGGFVDQFADAFVDSLIEGKFQFADFAKSVLKELMRIMVRAMIARALMAFLPGLAPAPTSTGIDINSIPTGFDPTGAPPVLAAMGAIVGPDGELPLKKFAMGGIATRPTIAVFGEGDDNEAFVPLPDGRTIPVTLTGESKEVAPNIEVNVINETGQPMNAEQGGASFDGEKYVLDVVLNAVTRPGQFRDGMKGAMG